MSRSIRIPSVGGAHRRRSVVTLAFLVAIAVASSAARADTIFDNFDPNGGFHPQNNSVGASSLRIVGIPQAIRAAARFTVTGGNVTLASITLPIAVQRSGSQNILRVRLAADNAGLPGATLEVLSENQNIWPTQTNPFATATTLNSITHPALVGGASYWIVCEPTALMPVSGEIADYRWFHNTTNVTVPFLQETESVLPTDPWSNAAVQNPVAFRVEGPSCLTDVVAGLPGVYGPSFGSGSSAWGDYDNDGDLDVLLSGDTGGLAITRVYRSSGGANPTFSDAGAGLTGIVDGGVAWGDYDRDGDLDILITGSATSKVYRNNGGANPTFTDIAAGLPALQYSSAAWGDYDNDGDLDFLLIGLEATRLARVYRNNGGPNPTFTNVSGVGLTGVWLGSAAWGDYDKDGDLDILLAGLGDFDTPISRVYRNSGSGTFSDVGAGLVGVGYSSVAWGDYDNDGDLDILLAGSTGATSVSRVYRNSGGANPTFSDIAAGITGLGFGSVAWGDYDNDGDRDILITGSNSSGSFAKIYRSSGGANPTFSDAGAGLPQLGGATAVWGDYDNDGDLEILLTGSAAGTPTTRIYRSACPPPPNSPPVAPSNLTASAVESATFSWNAATDGQTPSAGLSYNLRVGTTPGGSDILSPEANAATGFRRVTTIGNANQNTTWTLKLPGSGTYYWSVQAIDGAFAGSTFATEQVLDATTCFTDLGAGLAGALFSSAAPGDYDNDGDLDLLIAGSMLSETILYRSSGGANPTFANAGVGLPGVVGGSVAWGDYDKDGDLDVLITGNTNSRIYRNSGGANPTFSDIGAGLIAVDGGASAWGDYDSDDDLDILLTGFDGIVPISKIYRSSGGANPTFSDAGIALAGVEASSVAWGDPDNDGDLDIALAGLDASFARLTKFYRNNGGPNPTFTDMSAGLPSVSHSSIAWGDYDNDGRQDLLLAGRSSSGSVTKLFRNTGGLMFAEVTTGLPGVGFSALGSVAWGDYDKDGHLDILLAGGNGTSRRAQVYQNSGGANPTFAQVSAFLPGVEGCALAWADMDSDADLDIVITGALGGSFSGISRIYRNGCAVPKPTSLSMQATVLAPNTPPSAPTELYGRIDGTVARFSWNPASDAETPSSGLSYNLRVGTSPGAANIVSPMANATTGFRRVPSLLGNVNQTTTWEITLPGPGTYYWSVQAVDGSSSGSSFASEEIPVDVQAGADSQGYSLASDGPNPFSRSTTLLFRQPRTGRVSLVVYDSAGRRVRRLVDESLGAGSFSRTWDGTDDSGRIVQSGIYFTRMTAAGFEMTHKIVFVK